MVAIKNIRNMHAVSTNQIANILHFNDKAILENGETSESTKINNCVVDNYPQH